LSIDAMALALRRCGRAGETIARFHAAADLCSLTGKAAGGSRQTRTTKQRPAFHAKDEEHAVTLPRRRFLHLAAGAVALPSLSRAARADDYPSRPVRLVVGFPPGAATDIVGRLMAQALSERLGRQFFVENKPGAASNLGAETVINSAPDGYTLLAMTVTNAVNATIYEGKLNFDFVRDIAPVSTTIRSANVMEVNLDVPAKTVPEFIAYAKANPGKINYASFGVGTAPNMAGEMFKMMTGVNLVHVPYKSNYMPDLLSGQVQATFTPIPLTIGYIRAGQMRALAVTSAKPSEALPGVPTVAQFVPGYEASIWHGIAAPKGTPPEIVDKLNAAIKAVLTDPAMKPKFDNLGAEPLWQTPSETEAFIKAEVDKWAKVVKFADIKPE
jgi:tripartite-type tricarboxylate transporter receptor subunit TctC